MELILSGILAIPVLLWTLGFALFTVSLPQPAADRPTDAIVVLTGGAGRIQRGIDFLVATQAPDGSWPMISRSTPNGEEGSSKLLTPITCAASSWATLGLARLAPRGN